LGESTAEADRSGTYHPPSSVLSPLVSELFQDVRTIFTAFISLSELNDGGLT